MANRRRTPRISLVARLYLAGVAVFALSALAAWGIAHSVSHEWTGSREFGHFTRFVAASVAADADPRAAIDRAHRMLEADVALFDSDGSLIAHGGPVPSPPSDPPARAEMRARAGGGYDIGVDGGRTVVVIYRRTRSRLPWLAGIAGALLVIGAGAWVGGRAMTRRLARLGATARAITAGELGARTRLDSSDEIGEAAEAFDHMAERVEHLLRSQRELLASVSHELRTPLARLREALSLLDDGAADPLTPKQARVVRLAQRACEREIRIVRALLDLSRLQSGRALQPQASADVDAVLRAALDDEAAEAEARGVTLRLDADGAAPRASMDTALVERAVANIVRNAVSVSARGGAVTVSRSVCDAGPTGTAGHWVRVAVRDDGPGVPEALRATLFQAFATRAVPGQASRDGVGLGLALAREVMRAHGGDVTLDAAPPPGATFILWLPLDAQRVTMEPHA